MIKRLVAYGCSQTAALETNDNELMPELVHIKKQQGAMAFLQEVKKRIPEFNLAEYLDTQKENSYANLLATRLGLECSNRAVSGDSNSAMLWKIDQDIVIGNIKDDDLVIVGITSRERILHFEKKNIISIMLGYPDTWGNVFHKSFLNYHNSEMNAFNLTKDLRSLMYIGKTKLLNRLFFVETHPYFLNIDLSDWEKTNGGTDIADYARGVLTHIYTEIKTSGSLINDQGVTLITGLGQHPTGQLAGGHATTNWHKMYAEHLVKNMKEKLLLL